jgi:TonB family protein
MLIRVTQIADSDLCNTYLRGCKQVAVDFYELASSRKVKNNIMKSNFALVILLSSLVVLQGCGSKSTETENTSFAADSTAAQKEDEIAARKATLIRAKALKAEERNLAAAERFKLSATYKDANGIVVYNKAEVDPSYQGGMDAMTQYLNDNLKYPEEARKNGVEGTVFVDFVVNEKGKVREVIATDVVGEDVNLSLKEEAVRVVASMPGWIAGLQRGTPVDVAFSVPITFEIN